MFRISNKYSTTLIVMTTFWKWERNATHMPNIEFTISFAQVLAFKVCSFVASSPPNIDLNLLEKAIVERVK